MARGKATTNTIRKFTARGKRKRVGNATKVKYQAPTARNQKKQILSNAKAIKYLYKVAMPQKVYCDWQLFGRQYVNVDPGGSFTTTWQAFPLMSLPDWRACLRQDDNVRESSTTFIQRLSINMGYFLDLSNWCNFSVWIVTPRSSAADRDPTADIAAGQLPVQYIDYIEDVNAYNTRLNSQIYKVHFASYRSLTETTWFQAALPAAPAGSPGTTFARGQCNIRCNTKIRRPTAGDSWKEQPYMQIPYYNRYYLLVRMVAQSPPAAPAARVASFTFDQQAVTINSD